LKEAKEKMARKFVGATKRIRFVAKNEAEVTERLMTKVTRKWLSIQSINELTGQIQIQIQVQLAHHMILSKAR
jgi:hypothetical protein